MRPRRAEKKTYKRSIRRHHSDRLKAKRSKYYWWWEDKRTGGARRDGILANTPKLCSCVVCGNPRKHFNRPTYQEQKEEQEDYNLEADEYMEKRERDCQWGNDLYEFEDEDYIHGDCLDGYCEYLEERIEFLFINDYLEDDDQ